MRIQVPDEFKLLLHLLLLLFLLLSSLFLVLQQVLGNGGVLPRFLVVGLGSAND